MNTSFNYVGLTLILVHRSLFILVTFIDFSKITIQKYREYRVYNNYILLTKIPIISGVPE